MQKSALESLKKIHEEKAERALLISATGTGKTYLSAFDVAQAKPKKVLFLAHRKRILEASKESFSTVLGDAYSYGIFAGSQQERHSTCTFAMVSSIVRHLDEFHPLEFDYIIVDETHRAGAESYRKVLSHFAPKFLFGMTATPQRTDNYDIFKLYNHVIAYRITLQDALEEEMLSPFHYYGIADLSVEGEDLDDFASFAKLTSNQRVDHIIEKIEDYSVSKEHRRGLVFCSRNEEAKALSQEFNKRGYRTKSVSGANSDAERDAAIASLEKEDIQYLFSVDILNEGVDIPSVNQIIMLRPTESAIVFVQQLGRGLRKSPDKDALLVLDFIGNYQNNYLIPIALSGDRTYNKDNLRRFVKEGSSAIPGCSTVSFDRIAEQRIFEKLDAARFSSIKLVRDEYLNLRLMLGRIPSLMDFEEQGAIDPLLMFQAQGIGSYHDFLKKYEDDYDVSFDETQEQMLRYVSKKLADGKRNEELVLLQRLIENNSTTIDELERLLFSEDDHRNKKRFIHSALACLTNEFAITQQKRTYNLCVFVKQLGDEIHCAPALQTALANTHFKQQMIEIISFGLKRYSDGYSNNYRGTDLVLYQKYTYEDAFRLIGWPTDVNKQNVGGYMYEQTTNTFPVFINYHKEESISDTTKYEDRFISNRELIAISKSKRSLKSNEIMRLKGHSQNGVQVLLFVRKDKKDKDGGKEFYFLGEMSPTQEYKQFTMPNSTATAVEIGYELDTPVRQDIYDYLTSSIA